MATTLKNLDVDKVAAAVEADAGQALPGLRDSLAEAKASLALGGRPMAPGRPAPLTPPATP